MKNCILAVFLILVTANNVLAQKFLNGSIVFKDGKILKGLVEYPSNFKTAKISFKENETAEEQEFLSEGIKTVSVKESLQLKLSDIFSVVEEYNKWAISKKKK